MTEHEVAAVHEHWMRRAAVLARRAQGQTSPNPIVGAIVVKDGRDVGRGFHSRAGHPHAEAVALAEAGAEALGADLYVTLEPCAHVGRTPPCVDTILRAGIRRVIAAVQDPNPMVNGKGFDRLASAGITVLTGVLAPLCNELIRPYAVSLSANRPYVHLKLAMSADGRIGPATGSSRWITGPSARRAAHRLRGSVDAVLVGIGTVCADDPGLDVRLRRGRDTQPLPVVLDSEARLPLDCRVVTQRPSGRPPVVLCGMNASDARVTALQSAGVRVIPVDEDTPGRLRISAALNALARIGVQSVLVEGGGRVAASFVAAAVVDRATLFLAPVFLGSRGVASIDDLGMTELASAPRGRIIAVRRIGTDVLMELDLKVT